MMEMLRGFAGGYTAKILIGLLIASFALWGISGSILAGGNTVVQVGNTKIDTYDFRFAYENQLAQLSQQVQQRLTREQANAFGLQETVLSQVVSGAVLDENTAKMGLGLSDGNLGTVLAQDPAFRDFSGQFSESLFRSYLRQTGLSEKEFLADRKKIAMRNQIQQGTAASMEAPKAFLNAINTYDKQTRVFDYAIVGPDSLEKTPEPTDADIAGYYDENKDDFRAPEYRKVTILKLEASDFAKPEDITDEDVAALYETRKANLRSPEQRRVQQLVLKDQAEADSIAEKLNSGTSFEDVLAELGKKAQDIDLGMVRAADIPDENVRTAAFEAELNKPTAPVSGVFGPVIVRVTEVEAEKTTPFEDIKDELKQELALQRGGEEVLNFYDTIEDERAAGTTVADTASKVDVKTTVIEAIDSQGRDIGGNAVQNLPVPQQLIQQIFVSEPGDDTQALPIGNDGYVWYDVEEIIPDRQKDLDEVSDEVKAAWLDAETSAQVKAIAEDVAKKVRDGDDFNDILAATLSTDSLGQNIVYKTTEPLNRQATPSGITRSALQSGFSDAQGTIHVAQGDDNQHIILRIAKIEMPNDADLDEEVKNQVNVAAADDILNQVVQDFQSRVDVSVNRANMALAFTPGGGTGHGGL